VVSDSNQDEDVEPWYLFKIAVSTEFAALSKLFDRWNRVSILFFDIFVGRLFSERTVDEFAERLAPLVVLFKILQEVPLGCFG